LGTVQSTLGVGGRGREIFASATCSLQFAKASAATLPQQEKNDSANAKRGGENISGFVGTVARFSSRRFKFDELESLAVACCGRTTTYACLYRGRLRHKTSA